MHSVALAAIVAVLVCTFSITPVYADEQIFSGLEVTSVEGTAGSITRVPLVLREVPERIGDLDLSLSYNPSLLSAVSVERGEIPENATFNAEIERGSIHLTIQSVEGIGDGTFASIRFNVLATAGTSPLVLTHHLAKAASTRLPLVLPRIDGALTIIPGLSFTTSTGGERISLDLTLAGSGVSVSGDAIIFERDSSRFTCHTGALAKGANRVTGIIREVSVTSLPMVENLSAGQVTGQVTLTTPRYESEGRLTTTMSATTPPAILEGIRKAGEKSRLNVSTVLVTAQVEIERFPQIDALSASFTLPASVLSQPNATLGVAIQKTDGMVELLRPEIVQEPGEGRLSFTIPLKQGYPTVAIFLAQEVIRPPSTTVPRTTSGSIFAEGGEAASGSIWTGMGIFFFIVAIVVVSVFYVHRKRGG